MKFRFWHTYKNARGKHYGASLDDGYAVHVRGWDAGVTVTPRVRGRADNEAGTAYTDRDEFDVSITWGSHGGDRSVQIGTVRDTADGPMWIAEDVPDIYTRTGALARLRTHRIRRPRGPDYSAEHYADRRAESQAQADERPDWFDRHNDGQDPAEPADNAHTCTRHCGPGYHPDAETVQEIEAAERNGTPTAKSVLARIDRALAGPSLDSTVFGPEANVAPADGY